MPKELSNEQIAHDLTIAYVTITGGESISNESFYQDYENNYAAFLNLVKRND